MKPIVPASLALLIATPALAHVDPSGHGIVAGLSHPFAGADHLLAMGAVGVYAAILGGARRWMLPLGFVLGMTGGFGAALAGLSLPFVEPMIAASVVVLGMLIALAARLGPVAPGLLVAGFGLFHGHAHGSELGDAAAFGFGAGFVFSTLALHAAGVALGAGVMASGRISVRFLSALGGLTAASGMALAFG
jgi:urease accessory protein